MESLTEKEKVVISLLVQFWLAHSDEYGAVLHRHSYDRMTQEERLKFKEAEEMADRMISEFVDKWPHVATEHCVRREVSQ